MKTCNPCGRTLPETEFHWRNKAKGLRIAWCRNCASEKSKAHYQTNKSMYLRKTAKHKRRHRNDVADKILAYLKEHPCVDCGEPDPVVLHFDHVRGQKELNVAQALAKGWAWERVEAEIAKCDVRCANCHMRKTARDFGWRKFFAGEVHVGGRVLGTDEMTGSTPVTGSIKLV